jgi:hypothetical protein
MTTYRCKKRLRQLLREGLYLKAFLARGRNELAHIFRDESPLYSYIQSVMEDTVIVMDWGSARFCWSSKDVDMELTVGKIARGLQGVSLFVINTSRLRRNWTVLWPSDRARSRFTAVTNNRFSSTVPSRFVPFSLC